MDFINELVANFLNVVTKNYVNFSGRARRKEFWLFVLANAIIGVVFSILMSFPWIGGLFRTVYSLLMLALLLPNLGLSVRRLHDTGKDWPWLLLILTGIGAIVILVFCAQEGDRGDNAFGPDPKL